MVTLLDQTIKSKMKSAWNAGDYAAFAKYMEPGAEEILALWDIDPGQKMLDVACGTGQTSIPAARMGIHVTGIDFAEHSIQAARARADKEGLAVTFDEGDAESLPYDDESFDVVVTMVGAMFAPRPDKVASELLRVCRCGGHIRMVNWTPNGFIGQLFETIGQFVPPSPDLPSPLQWGDPSVVRERFGEGVRELHFTKETYPRWNYPFPVSDVVQFFFDTYGPMQTTLASLDWEAGQRFRDDLEAVFGDNSVSNANGTSLVGEYLHVDAIKK